MIQTKYISKDEALTIKGILISLIVLGHIHIVSFNIGCNDIRTYLYTFHVLTFFIIPYFYKVKNVCSWKRTIDLVVRSWIPYLWILILCLIALYAARHTFHFSADSICAIVNGTQTPLAEHFGFVFPWFLPAYCSFSLLLMVARKYKIIMSLLVLLSIITFFFDYNTFYAFKMILPFALGLAICYFAFGYIAFWVNMKSPYSKYIGAIMFVALSLFWWENVKLPLFAYKFLPISFFLLLLCILPICNCSFVRYIGKNSLPIYLFNIFIINTLELFMPSGFIYCIIEFVLTILVSCLIMYVIRKMPLLDNMLFPRSFNLFCRK